MDDVGGLAGGVGGLVAASPGVALLGPAAGRRAALDVAGVDLGFGELVAGEDADREAASPGKEYPDPVGLAGEFGEGFDEVARVAGRGCGGAAAPQWEFAVGGAAVVGRDVESGQAEGGVGDSVSAVEAVDPLAEPLGGNDDLAATACGWPVDGTQDWASRFDSVVMPLST